VGGPVVTPSSRPSRMSAIRSLEASSVLEGMHPRQDAQAAERTVVDERDARPEIAGRPRGGVPAASGADDDEIVPIAVHVPPNTAPRRSVALRVTRFRANRFEGHRGCPPVRSPKMRFRMSAQAIFSKGDARGRFRAIETVRACGPVSLALVTMSGAGLRLLSLVQRDHARPRRGGLRRTGAARVAVRGNSRDLLRVVRLRALLQRSRRRGHRYRHALGRAVVVRARALSARLRLAGVARHARAGRGPRARRVRPREDSRGVALRPYGSRRAGHVRRRRGSRSS
jgi:hypothetical protein